MVASSKARGASFIAGAFLLLAVGGLTAQTGRETADSVGVDTAAAPSYQVDTAASATADDDETTVATPADTATGPLTIREDQSVITPRLPQDTLVESFRNDPDFIYQEAAKPGQSFFEKLFAWLLRWLGRIFHNEVTGNTLPYVFFGLIVAFMIWKLVGADTGGIFARRDRKVEIDPREVEENIHEMDFDTLIADAVAEGRLRRAVRLLYLKLLKQMTDRGMIDWRIDKTNRDYLRELDASPLREPFAEATRAFEYVWYGDFAIDAASFSSIRAMFDGLAGSVGGGKR